jgi:uncharacterized protein (TIGR03083 family)
MSLTPLPVTDTRALFRPVSAELVTLLRNLEPDGWQRPTIAGTWVVRDIAAHLVDVTFRRLSFHRDRMAPPPPPRAIRSERDFVDFINWLNAEWVGATRRLSPRVLTDLFELGSRDLADWFEALPLDAPALFGVSWAGEETSEGWFDVGREFTELWHHQQQIRLAVGAPPLADPRFLRAVLEIALRGLPHAFRNQPADTGEALVLEVSGPAGGTWTLRRESGRWTLHLGEPAVETTRVRVSDEALWKLLHNALAGEDAFRALEIGGRRELAAALISARSIVVEVR